MTKLFLTAYIVLLALLAGQQQQQQHFVNAHVGTAHPLGEVTFLSRDEYIMCDKCTWDPFASGSPVVTGLTDAVAYYKLTCDTAAVNASKWGKLNYRCSQGCGTCLASVDIKIGSKIDALYSVASVANDYIAASINCCPEIVEHSRWADDVCATTKKSTFSPAGCSWDNTANTYEQLTCVDDGDAPENWKSGCTASPDLVNGDMCPSDPKCIGNIGLSNFPCLRVNGASTNSFSRQTYKCRKNGNQMCLRAVRSSNYVASMTPGTDSDLAKLTCSDIYSGVADFRRRSSSASIIVVLVVSTALAIVSPFAGLLSA